MLESEGLLRLCFGWGVLEEERRWDPDVMFVVLVVRAKEGEGIWGSIASTSMTSTKEVVSDFWNTWLSKGEISMQTSGSKL